MSMLYPEYFKFSIGIMIGVNAQGWPLSMFSPGAGVLTLARCPDTLLAYIYTSAEYPTKRLKPGVSRRKSLTKKGYKPTHLLFIPA